CLSCLLTRLAPLARLGLTADVLEELLLLRLEEGTMPFRLAVPARRPLAHVGELAERPVRERELEEVVAPDEVDAAAVAGEDGAGLAVARVGQATDAERAAVDQEQVAVVGDDARALVGRDVARREERRDGVRGLIREALGRAALCR